MDNYDIPFDGMSDEDFMYRAMNPEDPMYMGPEEDECDECNDDDIDDYDELLFDDDV